MNQCEMLNKISELQFVCVELNLYLNTNPQDEAARKDYRCYGEALSEMIRRYEAEYGPLMNFGHSPAAVGCHLDAPWPWD